MSLDNRPLYSGGCQCGAVRFRVEGALGRRLDLPLPHVPEGVRQFLSRRWSRCATRSSTGRAASRAISSRRTTSRAASARDCGTPLTYEAPDGMALAIGAFDDPAGIAPTIQWGTEAKLPYVDAIPDSARRGHDGRHRRSAPFLADLVSYQHPDHDTDQLAASREHSHERTAHALSRDRTLRDRHARCRRRPHASTGSASARKGAKPAVFLHGGPGGGFSPKHRRLFDPEALRRPPVRPARLRQVDAACLARGQHHLAPRRRHRAAARDGRLRQMAGLRRLLGLDAGARLCRDASRAGQRAGPARHLHADAAPNSTGTISSASRRCSPTSGSASWRRSPRPSAAT